MTSPTVSRRNAWASAIKASRAGPSAVARRKPCSKESAAPSRAAARYSRTSAGQSAGGARVPSFAAVLIDDPRAAGIGDKAIEMYRTRESASSQNPGDIGRVRQIEARPLAARGEPALSGGGRYTLRASQNAAGHMKMTKSSECRVFELWQWGTAGYGGGGKTKGGNRILLLVV